MKAIVYLETIGESGYLSALERQTIEVPDSSDADAQMSVAIQEVIEGWLLSPGDTIRIVEAV